MLYERVEGGSAVVIALIGETNILLIKNLERDNPQWKMIAETMKPGESILHTLKSGLEEEAGMKNIQVELGPDGKIAKFTDPRIKRVVEFGEREWLNTRTPHWRHVFGVVTTNEEIKRLSGLHHQIEEKNHRGEIEMEQITTMMFERTGLENMDGLLRQHSELIRSLDPKSNNYRKVREIC